MCSDTVSWPPPLQLLEREGFQSPQNHSHGVQRDYRSKLCNKLLYWVHRNLFQLLVLWNSRHKCSNFKIWSFVMCKSLSWLTFCETSHVILRLFQHQILFHGTYKQIYFFTILSLNHTLCMQVCHHQLWLSSSHLMDELQGLMIHRSMCFNNIFEQLIFLSFQCYLDIIPRNPAVPNFRP